MSAPGFVRSQQGSRQEKKHQEKKHLNDSSASTVFRFSYMQWRILILALLVAVLRQSQRPGGERGSPPAHHPGAHAYSPPTANHSSFPFLTSSPGSQRVCPTISPQSQPRHRSASISQAV